jgi:hypothetical protein
LSDISGALSPHTRIRQQYPFCRKDTTEKLFEKLDDQFDLRTFQTASAAMLRQDRQDHFFGKQLSKKRLQG